MLDGAVAVFCGVGGVEAQAETVWRQADRYRVPRLAFINKMDRAGADFGRVVEEMRRVLGAEPIPVQIPLGEGDEFRGVIDLAARTALTWDEAGLGVLYEAGPIPPPWRDRAERAREAMVDALAGFDEEVLKEYVERGDAEAGTIHRALRRATLKLRAVPVLCGSALMNTGIQPLLDAVVRYLPSPEDVPAPIGRRPGTGEPVTVRAEEEAPFAALVFKIMADPREGMLAYLRVYAGKAAAGEEIWNATRGRPLRLGRLFRMHADQADPVDAVEAGDIAVTVATEEIATGDSLCDPGFPVILEAMEVPVPVVSVAVEPRIEADRGRLEAGLRRMVEEDPSLRLKVEPATGQMVVSGMGELHLEIVVERCLRQGRIEARVGRPEVERRETVGAAAEAEGSFRGRGEFPQEARVVVRVTPDPDRLGWAVDDGPPAEAMTGDLRQAIRAGVEEALERGTAAGHPMTGVTVAVLDARWEGRTADRASLKIAAAAATAEALRRGGAKVVTPLMDVEILGPEGVLGEILADLRTRRAKVEGLDERAGMRMIKATAPLEAMFGYATDLRSRTRGRATFCMQFRRYAPLE